MAEVIARESIYLWYYTETLLRQIIHYWLLGIGIGSIVSVFAKDKIHTLFEKTASNRIGIFALIPASILGILSPLCLYGTIPIAAAFSKKGIRDDVLAAFMTTSILLNPQLLIYTAILGKTIVIIRVLVCFLCGIFAGLCVRFFFAGKVFFNFTSLLEVTNHDTNKNILVRLLKNIGRNIRATGPYFLAGILLTVLYQRYVPPELVSNLFGKQHQGFGVLAAASLGVPLYMCGGGTIPLLWEWIHKGMSLGSVTSFMISGPATKITNLGALKIVLGLKYFIGYLAFILALAVVFGTLVDIFL